MIEFEGLRRIDNDALARWFIDGLMAPEEDKGLRIGEFLPSGFEDYARIVNPSWIGGQDGRPVRWAEVAARNGMTVHHEMQFHSLQGSDDYWFEGEFQRPQTDSMSEHDFAVLASILASDTSDADDCFFCIWEGFGFLHPGSGGVAILTATRAPARKHRWRFRRAKDPFASRSTPPGPLPAMKIGEGFYLYRGSLATGGFRARPFYQSPNTAWDGERSWCLALPIDLSSTYVGASRACIDALLTCPDLEALETTLHARADLDSDQINAALEGW